MNDEKIKRIKYLRSLDNFSRSVEKALKKADFDEEKFKILLKKNQEKLRLIEPVFLDDPSSRALEDFANLTLRTDDKNELLRALNALMKFKNASKYKKQKHKKNFNDGY